MGQSRFTQLNGTKPVLTQWSNAYSPGVQPTNYLLILNHTGGEHNEGKAREGKELKKKKLLESYQENVHVLLGCWTRITFTVTFLGMSGTFSKSNINNNIDQ